MLLCMCSKIKSSLQPSSPVHFGSKKTERSHYRNEAMTNMLKKRPQYSSPDQNNNATPLLKSVTFKNTSETNCCF